MAINNHLMKHIVKELTFTLTMCYIYYGIVD